MATMRIDHSITHFAVWDDARMNWRVVCGQPVEQVHHTKTYSKLVTCRDCIKTRVVQEIRYGKP